MHDHDSDSHGDHEHGHGHGHGEHSELTPLEIRVRALESVLVAKGYVDPAALDVLIDTYQTRIGPRNGAQVVAKAWRDAAELWGATAAPCATPAPGAPVSVSVDAWESYLEAA